MADLLETETFQIKHFHPDLIHPTKHSINSPGKAHRTLCIGVPGSGKSNLIKFLLRSKFDTIPSAVAMSGTEDFNGFYGSFIPKSYVYNTYREEAVARLIKRQLLAKENGEKWTTLVIDDLMTDKSIFNTKVQRELFKNGRHFNIWYILAMQGPIDIPSGLRSLVSDIFILNQPSEGSRRKIWEDYASFIRPFSLFNALLDEFTKPHHALYISREFTGDWRDSVYYIHPPLVEDFNFGSMTFNKLHEERYEPNHERGIDIGDLFDGIGTSSTSTARLKFS